MGWILPLILIVFASPVSAQTAMDCASPTLITSPLTLTKCGSFCSGLTVGDVQADLTWCASCANVSALIGATAVGAPISAAIQLQSTKVCGSAAKKSIDANVCLDSSRGPNGCCAEIVKASTGETNAKGDKIGEIKKEMCSSGDIYYGDCYCRVGDTITPPEVGLTYQACTEKCQQSKGEIDPTQGIGLFKPKSGQTAGAGLAQTQFINAMCFTQSDCAKPEYGGSPDAFIPSSDCSGGKGKCLAPEPPIHLSSPVLGVTDIVGLPQYIALMFRYMLSIVVLAAAVMFIYGGFKYILGSSIPEISTAKQTMINATVGLLLSLGAYTILNTVNPATISLSRLNVFLINKQEFALLDWCKDYKPASGNATIKFANAGDPAGAIKYDAADFSVEQAKTMCGKDYYPQGFNGRTCKGQVCLEKGKICLACSSGLKECADVKTGSACIKAAFAGNISIVGKIVPKKVYLMGVCNDAQPPTSASKMQASIPDYLKATVTTGEGETNAAYYITPNATKLNAIKQECDASHGGLKGFVIGLIYRDTDDSQSLGIQGVANAQALGAGTIHTIMSAIGGTIVGLFPNVDDALIVTKPCNNPALYAGYADGKSLNADFTDMQRAFLHGYAMAPSTAAASFPLNRFDDPGLYWSYSELNTAMNDGEAISCDIPLNPRNAPADPEYTLWQYGEDYSNIPALKEALTEMADLKKSYASIITEMAGTTDTTKWSTLRESLIPIVNRMEELEGRISKLKGQ